MTNCGIGSERGHWLVMPAMDTCMSCSHWRLSCTQIRGALPGNQEKPAESQQHATIAGDQHSCSQAKQLTCVRPTSIGCYRPHHRYHPDKNPSPEARAKFLQVQKAYERLQAGAAGGQGPQAWRLLLMLKAQCILFRRYAEILAPFKYAGYPQLLEVLRQQTGSAGPGAKAGAVAGGGVGAAAGDGATDSGGGGKVQGAGHFLSAERVEQVLAAIELCWLTCVASRRNAEELMRTGGLPLLAELLSRWGRGTSQGGQGLHQSALMPQGAALIN
jgi:hypothetical protein